MSNREFTPSPQQQAVFDWVRDGSGSAFVEAVAGSGKTTTLIQAIDAMDGYISFAAFNKKIADEIKEKVGQRDKTRVATFHSFGFAAWRREAPGVQVEPDQKTKDMVEAVDGSEWYSPLVKLVSLAKQSCVGIVWQATDDDGWHRIIDHHDVDLDLSERDDMSMEEQRAHLIDMARRAIEWSAARGRRVIDYDDMLWLPLLNDCRFFQVDWLLVDEAQDTNVARRLMAERMLKRNGRAIFVGDRHQAIYGFTGADNDAIDQIIARFDCVQLPLTVTYRCPKSVVTVAQTWVSHIEAHESAPEGAVTYAGIRDWERELRPSLTPGDVILCRNTRPLVSLAFDLIRDGVGCHVEGRDIGKQLEKLATRWKVTTCADLVRRLNIYRKRETEKLEERPMALQAMQDRLDTLEVVMDGCGTVDEVVTKIRGMFKDSNGDARYTVVLSTVHKAKGREWDRVFVLGHETLMPSPYARQTWQKEQEANLQYVAVTRSQGSLVMLPEVG